MALDSRIELTDATWNVVTGCTKVSPGCEHCYAETFAERWRVVAGYLSQGKEHPTIHLGAPQDRPGLAPMLRRRADILHEWAAKDEVW